MKFTPTSETARQEVLEYAKTQMTSDDARKFLAEQGFFTGNLWHIDDVTSLYNCSNEDAYKVLDMALTNEYIISQIWDSIELIANDLDLEENEL
jgi:hypothetical protein